MGNAPAEPIPPALKETGFGVGGQRGTGRTQCPHRVPLGLHGLPFLRPLAHGCGPNSPGLQGINLSQTQPAVIRSRRLAMQQIFTLEAPVKHSPHPIPFLRSPAQRVVGEQVRLVPLVALGPGRASPSRPWVQMEHSSPGCNRDPAACSFPWEAKRFCNVPSLTVPSSWVSTVTLSSKSSCSPGGREVCWQCNPCWH